MAKIHILPPDEAQKIAAGEVVERPAAIVKELVENALDAGSTHLKLMCQDGGRALLRLVDNGHGMAPDDAVLCFSHHATSKIRSIADLEHLKTFGFRGEALSSIASVSKITLITRDAAMPHGVKIVVEGGHTMSQTTVSSTVGTDLTVTDLFYNVPVRRKFLKSADTEWRHILQWVHACCLSNKDVHVELVHNGTEVCNCPPADTLLTRALQIWGDGLTSRLLEINSVAEESGIRVTGLISDHQYNAYDRSRVFMFANGRWVKNQHLSRAILKGYQNVLQPGCFPVVALFVSVAPAELDINTHPRKEEVVFLHPKRVEACVVQAVKQTLEQGVARYLEVNRKAVEPVRFVAASATSATLFDEPVPQISGSAFEYVRTPEFGLPFDPSMVPLVAEVSAKDVPENVVSYIQQTATEVPPHAIIGQYHKTYIMLEQPDGLLFIDQHAAHERILYELFVHQFDQVATIKLLFPTIVSLPAGDVHLLGTHLHLLQSYGIGAEVFSETSVIVTQTPVTLKNVSIADVIKVLAAWLHEHTADDGQHEAWCNDMHEHMRAHMACMAAVKAGDELSFEQMNQLVEDLFSTTNRLTCPHGRPTTWLLPLGDIEKKFKRDYRSGRSAL